MRYLPILSATVAILAFYHIPTSQALLFSPSTNSSPQTINEEFVGPFANWTNVKTSYGAKGDGSSDDTTPLQNALNSLSSTNSTIYLPAGTYLITHTLTLPAQIHVNIIGQDPSNTTIVWGGAAGGTMLDLNGVAYSRFDRLTFNGQGNAAVIVDQSWDGSTGYFDTGNQYADDVFENSATGLRCGNLGYGCAETSMLRDQFLNDSVAGVAMMNFNALDMWIWYSLFQNDAEGATNDTGAGNFHVYNSIFENSTTSDISINNTGVFNFRNNYSTGSKQFIGASCTTNPANITVEGNTILDTTNSTSIGVCDLGPMVLIDNTIRSLASVTNGSVVSVANWNPSDLFSMGNTFTAGSLASPCTTSAPAYSNGHCHEINDQVVSRSTINPTMPALPVTPPNSSPQIFEVPSSMTTAQIQAQINSAASAGNGAVVHIQPGADSVTTTLVVPANSNMQIIGDGYNSQLVWGGSGTGPVIRLIGPSKATLRDFSVSGNSSANGIEVNNADQAGSSVFLEGANLGSSSTNFFVDGLDYTNVQLHDFNHVYDSTAGMTSVVVTGGPSAAQGNWLGGVTNIFAGSSGGNYNSYGVSNGAHVLVQDTWNDGNGGGTQVANVTGNGTFTYAGSTLFLPSGASQAAASINKFTGTAALVDDDTAISGGPEDFDITGSSDPSAQVLGLGLLGNDASPFNNTSNPAATTEFLNSQTTYNAPSGTGSSELPEAPSTPDTSFLTATLNQLRTEQPSVPAPLSSGVTDARFYRIFVTAAINGIHLDNISPDGSTLSYTSSGTLTTSDGVWHFSGTAIYLNGQQAAGGYGVLLLVYNGGQMYAENDAQLWYQWNGSGWTQIAGDPRG